jgi:thioredoxin reductase
MEKQPNVVLKLHKLLLVVMIDADRLIIKDDYLMRTNISGIFAFGDVTSKKHRQIAAAVAEGTNTAMATSKEMD